MNTYCPDCGIRLVVKPIEDVELHCCTNCGKIFMKNEFGTIRYVFQTSGNNSTRELFNFIEDKESK